MGSYDESQIRSTCSAWTLAYPGSSNGSSTRHGVSAGSLCAPCHSAMQVRSEHLAEAKQVRPSSRSRALALDRQLFRSSATSPR